MTKYVVTQDFIANQFQFELPNPNPQTKSFLKGDRIEASEQTDFGMNKSLVSDGFVIPRDKVILVSNGHAIPIGQAPSKLSGLAKFGIGVAIIVVIIGLLKLFKVF